MGVRSASISRTTKSWPARRPTARTSVGSTPGSAARRSSVAASAARRSTTSSTVKPRTFLPAPTSRSTVVPPWVPLDAGGSGWRSARQPSTTVTSVPRTLTRPATAGGAPGMRVVASRGRISRTRSASAAHRSPPTRNTSRRTTPASLIRCEEAKILQGVALSKQSRVPRCAGQRGHQVGGPFGAHCHRRPGNRMVEREAGGVQQLAGREGFDLLRRPPVRGRHASTATVRVLRIAHHGVTDIRQVHANLMSTPGAERETQQVGLGEARHAGGVRHRVPTTRQHGHSLAVFGVARDRRLDVDGAGGEMAPDEGRVHALHLALLDQPREPLVCAVGLRDEQQPRGIPVEPVHDPRTPLRRALRERRAPLHQDVHQRVVPVAGAGVYHESGRLVEHREVLVLEHEVQLSRRDSGGVCARLLLGGELDAHHGTALQPGRGPERRTVTGDAFVGDEAGGYRAGQRELIGYEAVEPLGFGGDDAERDGGHQGSAALASFARSCARPSSQRETASAIAPTVIAESATLKVGQRVPPIPTSTKSTTPWALRIRSSTLPTAPAHTSDRASSRGRSPGRADITMERSTNSATIASPKKIQREYAPRHSPNAAHWLYTRRNCT